MDKWVYARLKTVGFAYPRRLRVQSDLTLLGDRGRQVTETTKSASPPVGRAPGKGLARRFP
ncbi:hypothetical protein FRAAL4008 [Frankia alni ACN14a]|uniref:Uncharacterized protein n=1 Tax=Frankia alni (strain DSM 45986 / CECT 9034 / ACN14a) TaxID=326424 RepID=Q0RIL8_FRAAA|nr:hypothetical protein FRAAL4008 [Frankia alni ACN14a]